MSHLWVTIDCIAEYLVNGVAGCDLFPCEPTFDPIEGWHSDAQLGRIQGGWWLMKHPDCGRLDLEMQRHFLCDANLDPAIPRWDRFDMVRKLGLQVERLPLLLMSVPCTMAEWVRIAQNASRLEAEVANWNQSLVDPGIPF